MAAGLVDFFTQDHRSIDARWSEVEAAAQAGKTADLASLWEKFAETLLHHLKMEEQVLFPAFEAATGMINAGPTRVMRMEHEQMRGLLAQMDQAVLDGEVQELLDQGDTLLMLLQQHNSKEEGMLYPMASQVLGGEWADLQAKISELPR